MTAVFRDGWYQSVADKAHPQVIAPGGWRVLRWVLDDGSIGTMLPVLIDGPHDIDAYIVVTGSARVTVRIDRYPIDATDHGTHWSGPVTITRRGYLPFAALDRKGGIAGHGYGASILASRRVTVRQYVLKLDPRHYPA